MLPFQKFSSPMYFKFIYICVNYFDESTDNFPWNYLLFHNLYVSHLLGLISWYLICHSYENLYFSELFLVHVSIRNDQFVTLSAQLVSAPSIILNKTFRLYGLCGYNIFRNYEILRLKTDDISGHSIWKHELRKFV